MIIRHYEIVRQGTWGCREPRNRDVHGNHGTPAEVGHTCRTVLVLQENPLPWSFAGGALERCHRDGVHGGGKREGLLSEADHSAGPHGYLSFFENPEMPGVVSSGRSGFLDFQGIRRAVLKNEKVDFRPVLVPVIEERSLAAVVPVAFQQFAHDPGFEDGAGHRPDASVSGLDHSVR